MSTGTVKWFNDYKGYGFISPDDNTKDVFLHISALEKANIRNISEGQHISYQISNERGRNAASDIKLI